MAVSSFESPKVCLGIVVEPSAANLLIPESAPIEAWLLSYSKNGFLEACVMCNL